MTVVVTCRIKGGVGLTFPYLASNIQFLGLSEVPPAILDLPSCHFEHMGTRLIEAEMMFGP